MPTNGFIAVIPIRPGEEQGLRERLNRIGNDLRGRRLGKAGSEPHLELLASDLIHFTRLALLADPERGADRRRLLVATDFDGSLNEHAADLYTRTVEPGLIWGACEGFCGRERFAEFLEAHVVDPQAWYIAFPGQPLGRLRELLDRKQQRDLQPVTERARGARWQTRTLLATVWRIIGTACEGIGLLIDHGPVNTLLAARRINATLNRITWIRWFNRLLDNRQPPPRTRFSEASLDQTAVCSLDPLLDEIVPATDWDGVPAEDLVSQNQLTLVTRVRPERLRRLEATLAIIDLYARRLTPPGSLVGISTIHTVRWALIDGGRRLLMVSNYDNTWENYIDEFAEMILSGLDALWENCLGWPVSGAQDVAALKQFLRCHQVPAQVFYSAYPQATVLQFVDALNLEPDPS